LVFCFLVIAILMGVKWHGTGLLIHMSLLTSDTEHCFIVYLSIFFGECGRPVTK
jgi:hypothetical protein